jgi:hypothetical protein
MSVNFAGELSLSYSAGIFDMPIKSYDMGPKALLLLRKSWYGFLLPLKINSP